MAAQEFFQDQLDQLKAFMADPGRTVRCLHVDSDLKPVLVKMLSGFDRDPNNPHVLIPSDAAFDGRDKFFRALLKDVSDSYEASAHSLQMAGVFEPFTRKDLRTDPPDKRVVLYLCSLAEGLPDHVGSLVVILDPAGVADAAGFREALAWLADNTWSHWVKYLVLDDRLKPRTDGVEGLSDRASKQVMYQSPEEFEARIRNAVMHDPHLAPDVRRRYTAMLGGFALARKDFPTATEMYRQQIELTRLDRAPAEEAQAHYCLGNVMLAQKDFPAAEEAHARALELAVAHQQPHLMGLVLVQLGVALARQGKADEAERSFDIARQAARNTNTPPLEAHALDTQAQCFLAARDTAAAERCWKEALAVYDGITSDAFPDVKEAGRKDILMKLDMLAKHARQPRRLADLITVGGGA